MSDKRKSPKTRYTFKTGRTRAVKFRLLGSTYTLELAEYIEVIEIATGKRLPRDQWFNRGLIVAPVGCTPRYFERRVDTGERMTDYQGYLTAHTAR